MNTSSTTKLLVATLALFGACLQAVIAAKVGPAATSLPAASLLADDKSETKTYEGTLETGIMAIGGETTGTTLKTKADGQYELDLQGNAELQKLAEALNGKKVTVEGIYKPRAGVEVKERRIILVKSLKEAK